MRPNGLRLRSLALAGGVSITLFLGASARGELPVPGVHSLNLEAKVVSTGGATDGKSGLHVDNLTVPSNFLVSRTRTYTQHQTKESSVTLAIDIRNLATHSDSAKMDWYFFARPISGRGGSLSEHGSEDVSLLPSRELHYTLQSKPLHSSVTKTLQTHRGVNQVGLPLPDIANVHKSGSRLDGWIVRLMVDDKPIVVRASSPSFEMLGHSDSTIVAYSR